MSTPNTREGKEGITLDLGNGTKATLYEGLRLEKRHLDIIQQELQKARGEAVIWTMRNFETMHKEDWGTKTFGEYMIDRYPSELDQDNK